MRISIKLTINICVLTIFNTFVDEFRCFGAMEESAHKLVFCLKTNLHTNEIDRRIAGLPLLPPSPEGHQLASTATI